MWDFSGTGSAPATYFSTDGGVTPLTTNSTSGDTMDFVIGGIQDVAISPASDPFDTNAQTSQLHNTISRGQENVQSLRVSVIVQRDGDSVEFCRNGTDVVLMRRKGTKP